MKSMTSFRERTGDFLAQAGEVAGQARLEFVQQHRLLRLANLVHVGDLGRIDERRPLALEDIERTGHDGIHCLVKAKVVAGHADPRSFEAARIERLGVVGDGRSLVVHGGFVGWVGCGEHSQQDRRVANSPGHWAGGVLRMRDRDHAGPANQADSRLDPHDAVSRGWADDGPVRFGADSGGTKVGGDGHAGPELDPHGLRSNA